MFVSMGGNRARQDITESERQSVFLIEKDMVKEPLLICLILPTEEICFCVSQQIFFQETKKIDRSRTRKHHTPKQYEQAQGVYSLFKCASFVTVFGIIIQNLQALNLCLQILMLTTTEVSRQSVTPLNFYLDAKSLYLSFLLYNMCLQ